VPQVWSPLWNLQLQKAAQQSLHLAVGNDWPITGQPAAIAELLSIFDVPTTTGASVSRLWLFSSGPHPIAARAA
jgi:hypothetical protein